MIPNLSYRSKGEEGEIGVEGGRGDKDSFLKSSALIYLSALIYMQRKNQSKTRRKKLRKLTYEISPLIHLGTWSKRGEHDCGWDGGTVV